MIVRGRVSDTKLTLKFSPDAGGRSSETAGPIDSVLGIPELRTILGHGPKEAHERGE